MKAAKELAVKLDHQTYFALVEDVRTSARSRATMSLSLASIRSDTEIVMEGEGDNRAALPLK